MAQITDDSAWTAADLFQRFGPIPLHRIVADPAPGTATEDDVIWQSEHRDRLCELVDGVLVEKAMGYYESFLGGELFALIRNFVVAHALGLTHTADALFRLAPNLVRIPDVAFVSWNRLPGGRVPQSSIADLVLDLAVEIISRSNTLEELEEKLRDYFDAGVRLVWYVYPALREVHVFRSAADRTVLRDGDTLDGGAVLPGFALPLTAFFNSGVRPE